MTDDARVQQLLDQLHDSHGTPEEVCESCPELLPVVRERWRQIRRLRADLDALFPSPDAAPRPLNAAPFRPAEGAEPIPGYRLEGFLGKGGFGEVWRAVGPGGFKVALKFLAAEADATERELRSLQMLQNVRDARLLCLHGVCQTPGWFVLAMELADGTLADRLKECRKTGLVGVPRDELLRYFEQAAEGLDFLNEPRHVLSPGAAPVSIGHGDVKPQNLLIVGRGVKLGDFGLLRRLSARSSQQTNKVTLAYAPPEAFKGRHARQSDQYALAVSWCQLRGGRLPFVGDSAQLAADHLYEPPDLTMLPEAERAPVARAMSKQPGERWPSCAAFIEAVRQPDLPENVTFLGTSGTRRLPRFRARAWMIAGLALTALVVLGSLLAFWSLRTGQPDGDKFVNAVGMTMIPIKPGTFKMGSSSREGGRHDDEELHEVQITRPYLLAAHPVTVGQFRQFVEDQAYHGGKNYQTEPERDGQGGWGWNEDKKEFEGRKPKYTWKDAGWKQEDDYPVVNVTWNDAVAYCVWLTKKEGKAGFEYRLPTEAEWEYACRAGTKTAYFTGDEFESLKDYANIADASLKRMYPGATYGVDFDDGFPFTSPVGKFKPNDWGLYDMHGNVWQWCSDRYGKYDKEDNKDPQGTKEGDLRVQRGGAWSCDPGHCRAAVRFHVEPASRDGYVGFRVAASASRTP
jgi:formylglycine-generating enzyme required for sulfatase activity